MSGGDGSLTAPSTSHRYFKTLLEILINTVHAWIFDFIHPSILFIYKKAYVSVLFLDPGCRKHGSSKGRVILFGKASTRTACALSV
jgi:hypothetical protein